MEILRYQNGKRSESNGPMKYQQDALAMLMSSFPQEEKNRHYRELLVKMKSQYGHIHHDASNDRYSDIRSIYNWIESIIN
jgi:hypothetical protein